MRQYFDVTPADLRELFLGRTMTAVDPNLGSITLDDGSHLVCTGGWSGDHPDLPVAQGRHGQRYRTHTDPEPPLFHRLVRILRAGTTLSGGPTVRHSGKETHHEH